MMKSVALLEDHDREVRARFMQALSEGASVDEATTIANRYAARRAPIVPPPAPAIRDRIATAVRARDPLDHDGDGRKGGSPKPPADAELATLRAEYQAKVGKRPFPGWKSDELRRRMSEA